MIKEVIAYIWVLEIASDPCKGQYICQHEGESEIMWGDLHYPGPLEEALIFEDLDQITYFYEREKKGLGWKMKYSKFKLTKTYQKQV